MSSNFELNSLIKKKLYPWIFDIFKLVFEQFMKKLFEDQHLKNDLVHLKSSFCFSSKQFLTYKKNKLPFHDC